MPSLLLVGVEAISSLAVLALVYSTLKPCRASSVPYLLGVPGGVRVDDNLVRDERRLVFRGSTCRRPPAQRSLPVNTGIRIALPCVDLRSQN